MRLARVGPIACLTAGLWLAGDVGLYARAGRLAVPEQVEARQPRFRSALELVTADVVVVDRDGAPVRDLTAQDFAVRVDGDVRAIASVQFVDFTATSAAPDAAGAPLYATNEHAGRGRLLAFVVDQGNIRAGGGQSALARAAELLDRLTPADRVALFVVPGPGPSVPFTNDFDRVREALRRVAGRASRIEGSQYPLGLADALAIADGDRRALQEAASRYCSGAPSCESDIQAEAFAIVDQVRERTLSSLRGLAAVFERLKEVEGPKTVVLVSEGLALGRELDLVADLGATAAAARASLYALRLDASAFDAGDVRSGSTLASDARVFADGLETLAGFARGAVFTVAASGAGVFERLARELSSYYLVAFEPAGADRDGRSHQIRVEVKRGGVVVRARREFRAEPAPGHREAPSAEVVLTRALAAPTVMTDLGIRLSAYVFADEEDAAKVRIALSAEIGRDRETAEEMSLAFALLDESGRLVASGLQRQTLLPARADQPGPLIYHGSLSTPPGDFRLRLAVVDGDGRVGSVDHPVRARLTDAPPLRLGDLAVGRRAPGVGFVLPAVPRVDAAVLVAYVEFYGERDEDLEQASVRVEIAGGEDGPALVGTDASLAARAAPGRRVATSELDATVLPPGRYVARAAVSVAGRTVGSVFRRFDLAAPAVVGPPLSTSGLAPGDPAAVGAGGGVPTAGPPLDVRAVADPFRREVLLAPERIAVFLDELVGALPAGVPAALALAIDEARAGRVATAADRAAEPALHPVSTFLRGLAALAGGDRQAAAALFRSTLQAARGSYAALVYLGACYAEGGRDDEAAGAWQTALVGFEDLPLLYTLVIDAALRYHDLRTARATVDEARARWPSDDEFLRREALVRLASGRPADGLAALDEYLARHPADTAALALGVRAIYQVAAAGGVIVSPAGDLARARRYADAYVQAGGADRALVQVWLGFLERRR